MAIQFARIQYVSRGQGGSATRKSAYAGRLKVKDAREGKTYNYSRHEDNVFHQVLLPEGADKVFGEASVLWNAAELAEVKRNARVARELVVALPDDEAVSLEDKKDLIVSFVEKEFVAKGMAAQVDIHAPHETKDHNWHAHVLVTVRRFTGDGKGLGEKARDLDGDMRGGYAQSPENWGRKWAAHQNGYFKAQGIDLEVDPVGMVSQTHLGPVRLRVRGGLERFQGMMARFRERCHANENGSMDSGALLTHLSERHGVFHEGVIDRYLEKHVAPEVRESVKGSLMKEKGLVLIEGGAGSSAGAGAVGRAYYSTKRVMEEAAQVMSLADKVISTEASWCRRRARSRVERALTGATERYGLSEEQRGALEGIMGDKGLACLTGRAGTGKGRLLSALHGVCEAAGLRVIGVAPTSDVAFALEASGIKGAQTLHRLLFRHRNVRGGVLEKGDVVLLDEAGMVGMPAMKELMKAVWRRGCTLVLVGDERQLGAVSHGGAFEWMRSRYGASVLRTVYRQETWWGRSVAASLGEGQVSAAVSRLEEEGGVHWHETRALAMTALVRRWVQDRVAHPERSQFVMEQRNKEVGELNKVLQEARVCLGELSGEGVSVKTHHGAGVLYGGDEVIFRQNDRAMGVSNGQRGVVRGVSASEVRVGVKVSTYGSDDGEVRERERQVVFDPRSFSRYQLGYAGTVHQAQGKTVDNAYVLHSPYTRSGMFYVGVTRHAKRIGYFVSREEAKDVKELLAQVGRSDGERSVFPFAARYEEQKAVQAASGSSLSSSLSVWSRGVVGKGWRYLKDLMGDDKSFYTVEKEGEKQETKEGGSILSTLSSLLKPGATATMLAETPTNTKGGEVELQGAKAGPEGGVLTTPVSQIVAREVSRLRIEAPLYRPLSLAVVRAMQERPQAEVMIVDSQEALDGAKALKLDEDAIVMVSEAPSPPSTAMSFFTKGNTVTPDVTPDLSLLQGRDVVIWCAPDETGEGHKERLKGLCERAGVTSVTLVDKGALARAGSALCLSDVPGRQEAQGSLFQEADKGGVGSPRDENALKALEEEASRVRLLGHYEPMMTMVQDSGRYGEGLIEALQEASPQPHWDGAQLAYVKKVQDEVSSFIKASVGALHESLNGSQQKGGMELGAHTSQSLQGLSAEDQKDLVRYHELFLRDAVARYAAAHEKTGTTEERCLNVLTLRLPSYTEKMLQQHKEQFERNVPMYERLQEAATLQRQQQKENSKGRGMEM